jgi:hypothetical protein
MPAPPNLAQYRLPATTRLRGRSTTLELGQDLLHLDFDASGHVAWRWQDGRPGTGSCDAVEVRPGTFFVAVDVDDPPTDGLSVLFAPDGAALVVAQQRLPGAVGGVAVRNCYLPGRAAGSDAEAPAPTSDLLGRWQQVRYSDENLYEHIYLSSDRFCSHNLATQNTAGRADCHPVDYWRFADGLYLVAWRERGSGAAMIVVDDLAAMRSTGAVLHPATASHSVVVPVGGLLETLRMPRDPAEVRARARVQGWEPGEGETAGK